MVRAFFLVFITLAAFVSGLLFWQWEAYSEQNERINKDSEKVTQELSIESTMSELKISQTFVGLQSGKEYTVVVPDQLFRWECIDSEGQACQSSDENPHTFKAVGNELMFAYVIPIENPSSAFLLQEWTSIIPEVDVTETTIEVTESIKRDGTWVAGLPLIGHTKKDFIDYYQFKGIDENPSLYWQSAPLAMKEIDGGMIYGQEIDDTFDQFKKLSGVPYLSVVLTNQYHETVVNGLMIMNSQVDKSTLENKLAQYDYERKFIYLAEKDHWLVDMFAAMAVNQSPKSEKGKQILSELQQKLSQEEFTAFFEKVDHEQEITQIEALNGFIQDVKGLSTDFFTMNMESLSTFVPLYLYDHRKIMIADQEQNSLKASYVDGRLIFPFSETMKSLGFEVNQLDDQKMLLLNKGKTNYRFYLDRNIFIHNEEEYGLLQKPLMSLNGKIYIEKQWLQSIFQVNVIESEQEIVLSMNNQL